MRKRVPVVHTAERGFHVDLPTYVMVPGSWLPVSPALIHADGPDARAAVPAVLARDPTVEVELPDGYPLAADGELDAVALRRMYRDHPRFRLAGWVPPKFRG